MKKSAILMGFALATACAAAPTDSQATDSASNSYNEVEQPSPMPTELRGMWAKSARDCGDEYATSRLGIGANWIAMHEMYGLLQISSGTGGQQLNGQGKLVESLTARFAATGEFSVWDLDLNFKWDKSNPSVLAVSVLKSDDKRYAKPIEERYVRCN